MNEPNGIERPEMDDDVVVPLYTVAETFQVEAVVLERAYVRGLLGTGIVRETTVHLRAVQLDRVATFVRLHVELGVDLDTLEWMIGARS